MGFMARGVRSRCMIQHEAKPSAVSATRPHPECHKSHKGLQTNFKWFIVACTGGSGAFHHLMHASSGCR